MKNNPLALLTAAIILCAATQHSYAQTTALKLNIPSLALLAPNIGIEQRVTDQISIGTNAFINGLKISDIKYSGYGFTPFVNYHFKGEGLSGLYAGGFGIYKKMTLTTEQTITVAGFDQTINAKTTLKNIGGGARIGYQHIFDSGFLFDVALGPKIVSKKITVEAGEEIELPLILGSPIGLNMLIQVGYAF